MKSNRLPDTSWSLLGRAAGPSSSPRAQALSNLVAAYRPALLAYLVRARRLPIEDAEDVLHGFLAEKFISPDWLRRADPLRGRFRNYLLASLNNHLSSALRRDAANSARMVDIAFAADIASPAEDELSVFSDEWTKHVARQTMELMKEDCMRSSREDLWEIFRLRICAPALDGVEPTPYAEISTRLGFRDPRQALNLLTTAKRTYARHLRTIISRYAATEAEIEEELADLKRLAKG